MFQLTAVGFVWCEQNVNVLSAHPFVLSMHTFLQTKHSSSHIVENNSNQCVPFSRREKAGTFTNTERKPGHTPFSIWNCPPYLSGIQKITY